MAGLEIKYTDASIKYYTEKWAVIRLDKRRYVGKQSLSWAGILCVSSLPTSFHQGFTLWSITARLIPAVLMAYLGGLFTYWWRERAYQKFLKYQTQKRLAGPNPRVYYN